MLHGRRRKPDGIAAESFPDEAHIDRRDLLFDWLKAPETGGFQRSTHTAQAGRCQTGDQAQAAQTTQQFFVNYELRG
jgi:hypothetical protein